MSQKLKDIVALLVFFGAIVLLQIYFGKTFVVGFFTDFEIVELSSSPDKFWFGIKAQLLFLVMLCIAAFIKKERKVK